jgi:exonuclease SbcC
LGVLQNQKLREVDAMIEKLILKNFQSHKLTVLDFDPGVNCIIGSSDVGKTAIIRALRWLVWNRPQGDAFRSSWGGETCVTAQVNGNCIERVKGSENAYILNDDTFKAIKTDVPVEIATALNFDEINLQSQFDRPFLLDSAPGEVALHFNRIAHLDVIDTAIKAVQSWLRQIDQSIQADQSSINEANEELKKYEGIEEIDGVVSSLEMLDKKRINIIGQINKLKYIIDTLLVCDQQIVELEKTVKLGPSVETVICLIGKGRQVETNRNKLSDIISNYNVINTKLAELNTIIALEEPVANVITLNLEIKAKTVRMSVLDKLSKDAKEAIREFTANATILLNQQETFNTNFPDICPLCGATQHEN